MYLRQLILPSEKEEIKVIESEKRTCFNTFYPYKIFPDKGLRSLEFGKLTLLYGGNGSGKSTLLNVMARLTNAVRYSEFNDAPLFDRYARSCEIVYSRMPRECVVLTSDDVFNYVLNARSVNERLDEKRDALFDKYVSTHREAVTNPEIGRLRSFDDFDRWKETREILSPKKSQSAYIRSRVTESVDLFSNGETAMQYFIDRLDRDAVYFLDEPENSLSVERQTELAEYLEATALSTDSQLIIATHSPILLSMKRAKIYDLDSYPVSVARWTDLPNVRRYYEFFMAHREEFD